MDAHSDPEAAMRDAGVVFSDYRPQDKTANPNHFGRLRVLSAEDALDAPPREHLLDGLIAPGEFSVWWGAPKCGKSFLLLRIAYGLAQGVGLWGREAVAVSVCYVAAEGGNGIKGRIHALRKRMGPAPGFHFIAQGVDLFDPEADLGDLIAAVSAFGSRFVVLDTLARVMGAGNENATPDMNAFVRNCLRNSGGDRGACRCGASRRMGRLPRPRQHRPDRRGRYRGEGVGRAGRAEDGPSRAREG